ncbi:MAG TPA: NRDE family protein, partial [Solimonas sp.]|nr:NRDE family protein [Solimonas sp.]
MCLIALAWQTHPAYPLVLAANRDEFHHRPTAPAAFWADAPMVYGGRDLSQHGSWLALSRGGRVAAVTNVRRMIPPNPHAPSRGVLVSDFVGGSMSAQDYADHLTG